MVEEVQDEPKQDKGSSEELKRRSCKRCIGFHVANSRQHHFRSFLLFFVRFTGTEDSLSKHPPNL